MAFMTRCRNSKIEITDWRVSSPYCIDELNLGPGHPELKHYSMSPIVKVVCNLIQFPLACKL